MTTTGIGVHDQNIEKHMGGCMAGFFNLFERSPSKRLYPKRLPPPLPSPLVNSPSESDSSTVGSTDLVQNTVQVSPKPDPNPDSPKSPVTVKSPLPSPSPWKFAQAPRLSLDSRAIVDAKGSLRPRDIKINTTSSTTDDEDRDSQRRSPSVVARLMGLELLPSSTATTTTPEPEEKKVELRRSASESRSRDYNRFFDTSIFVSPTAVPATVVVGEKKSDRRSEKTNEVKQSERNQRRLTVTEKRRSYYNTADFYPPEKCQQNHQAVTIYGEIERRLKMRGIDETSKDLETLKNILEALQLKGLLHSNLSQRSQNVVVEESPITVTKPVAAGVVPTRRRASRGESLVSPRRERPQVVSKRNERSTSPVRRKGGPPLSVETQRRVNETTSPRMRRVGVDNQTVNRSPRNRRSTVEICQGDKERLVGSLSVEDEVSTVSESSFGTSSHPDNERWRVEEYREGRNLLERCDKLLNSIAEMTCKTNSNTNSTELQQPSPVSVLDPSFYKEDESSPSPVKKRTIVFKEQVALDIEDELWSPSSSTQLFPKPEDMDSSDDSELSYVSEVLRASNYLPDESNLFHLLEKQNSIRGNKDRSRASILQRKLIFDTITEILDRHRQLPPWKAALLVNEGQGRPMLDQIWSEFQKIREHGPSDDLLEVICRVLKKDLDGDSINGWRDCHVEMSEAVLDIERLIFKDLISETIQDLAAFGGKNVGIYALRRKLVF